MRHRIIMLFLLGILLICPRLGFSQEHPNTETYRIAGISVEGNNGRTGTESSAIIANSGLRIGDEITIPGDQTRGAIARLWALKIFSDIEIFVDNKINRDIYLAIKVKEYPRLDHVEVKGADDVSKDDILKKITTVKGQIITPEDINKIISN
ncbi:MAG TPA: outer membrane protein assembly factor BamA, partial [Bacteroidota bacterium]|nr:outer membrane protein assembly factor BamA [Bacteroidota bacterium]